MPVTLTSRQRAVLKARAHSLEPLLQVGQAGITDAVAAEADRTLTAHELVKVRFGGPDRDARGALIDALCARTDATDVQRVGKVAVLWRPRPEEAKEE